MPRRTPSDSCSRQAVDLNAASLSPSQSSCVLVGATAECWTGRERSKRSMGVNIPWQGCSRTSQSLEWMARVVHDTRSVCGRYLCFPSDRPALDIPHPKRCCILDSSSSSHALFANNILIRHAAAGNAPGLADRVSGARGLPGRVMTARALHSRSRHAS